MLVNQTERTCVWMPCLVRQMASASVVVVGLNAAASAGQAPELSESEMAGFRDQVTRCWNIPTEAVGAKGQGVSVKVELDPSGALRRDPAVVSGESNSRLAQSAIRAVKRCSPFTLPAKKYDAWAEITINFDPSEMK
ncbi:cell envelope integrity protein TolA [Mesorhizobium sp. ASY16-5R]|jgi:TonB family protein|uniref:cell envelope integrity protein TolA n=1 Tax=Mesorhizobium sp. ASY16-5R TaxID=3445772 RepID=UPI003FA0E0E1